MDAAQIMQLIAQGQHGEAAEACEHALDQVRREGDLNLEAKLTHLLGIALTRMERFEEAITMFTRSAQLSFALDNLNGVHAALLGVAEAYQCAGNYDKAWHNLERARDTAEAVGNRAAEARSLAQMVNLALAQNDPGRGISLGEESYKMMLGLHSPPAHVHPLALDLSKLYLLAGRPGDAVLPALTALTTGLRLHKSQAGQALTHLLGVTRAVAGTDGLRAVGDVGQALQSLLSREDQEAWTPDGALTGEIAAILASFFIDAGRLTEQATPAQLETVRRRSREIEAFFVGEASLQEWLNAVLESLPEPAQPPPITQQDRKAQESLQRAIADYQQERLDEALLKAGQALTHFRQTDDRHYIAACLTVLERTHAKLGELERAIALCSEAYRLFTDLGDSAPALDSLSSMSDYALKLGEYDRAAIAASQMIILALQMDARQVLSALKRSCDVAQHLLVKGRWAELERQGKGLAASSKQVEEKGQPGEELKLAGRFVQQVGLVIGLAGASGGDVNSPCYREALRLAAQLDKASSRQFNLVALLSSIE
jgi:tetratricopeptide (TPR) repeat protein